MRFHVLGLGAVGSLVSHHLRRALPAAHHVHLIFKSMDQLRSAIRKEGVVRVENEGLSCAAKGYQLELYHGPVSSSQFQPSSQNSPSSQQTQEHDSPYIDSVFVTLKAHQTLPALRKLSHRLSPDSTIVLLQNGMGVYEELVRELFRNPRQRPHFILASNTHGVFSRGLLDTLHTGMGEVRFGIVADAEGRDFEAGFHDTSIPLPDRRARLADIAQSASTDPSFVRYKSLRNTVAALLLMDPLNTSWLPMAEVQIALRRKLVVNAVINPLTAVLGCRNGDLLGSEMLIRHVRSVCKEAAAVYAAEVCAEAQMFVDNAGQDIDQTSFLLDRVPTSLSRESLEKECLRVAHATKANISSMLADIRLGRPTEIDYINGHLLRLGKAYNVYMPVVATLQRLVRMRSAIPLDQMF